MSELKRHQFEHDADKVYSCNACHQTFDGVDRLVRHQCKSHTAAATKESPDQDSALDGKMFNCLSFFKVAQVGGANLESFDFHLFSLSLAAP